MRDMAMATAGFSQYSPTTASEQRTALTSTSMDASASDSEAEHTDESQAGSSKKRKRGLKISCEMCKARKVKCDRAEPSCGWCARNNRPCVYQERKKPGLRLAYGRELEDKINRLEAVLHSLGRRVEDHIVEHDVLHHKTPASFSNGLSGPTPYPDIPRSAASDTASRSTPILDNRWPQTSSSYEPEQYHRPAETMSVHSIVDSNPDQRNLFERPSLPTSAPPVSNRFIDQVSTIPQYELPPYDLLYTLVDLFFKHVNPWSPILDRKSTFDACFGGSSLSEADRVLLHAIVATTLRFSKDPRLTPVARKQYYDGSRQRVQLYSMEHPSITALQALVILAVDILGTSNGPQGWNLLALITRNVVQLGLGIEKTVYLGPPSYSSISSLQAFAQSPPKSWIEEEERRRLVWMVYILDRYATVAIASAFTFDDQEMDRRLPCRYDLFSKNQAVETRWPRGVIHHSTNLTSSDKSENLGSFSYHCEVLTILSRVHNFLKLPLDINSHASVQSWRESYQALDGELNTWLHSLPGEYGKISQLCHSDPGSKISNWIMLHAAFVTAVIRLHSAAAYPTVRSHIFTPSYNAMQRCLGAVESLREIAQDTLNTSMLDLLGPPFAFSLWTSARLLLVHAATMECEVDPKIRFFISTLEQMGRYWDVAHVYAETLSRVVKETEESQQAHRKSFKSMRKTAYELNLLTSRRSHSTTLELSSVRIPTSNELEYLDIFDFFNYPLSISTSASNRSRGTTETPSTATTGRARSGSQSQSLPGGLSDIENEKDGDFGGANQPMLTPNFAMPSRDSDWLNFQPPHE